MLRRGPESCGKKISLSLLSFPERLPLIWLAPNPRRRGNDPMKMSAVGLILASVLFVCLSAGTGQSNDINYIKKRIAASAAIKGDLERLESYDQLAIELGLVSKAIVLPTKGTGKWSSSSETNPVDDSTTVVLSLTADEGRSRMMGEPIVLIIRCRSNKTELYINWNDYLGEDVKVLTRVGDSAAVKKLWSVSTNRQSSFYFGSPIEFIKTLIGADRLVAQVTPYQESQVTAIFDIRGLAEAIKPLQATCGWK
jgi:type VI secretion system protein VasI